MGWVTNSTHELFKWNGPGICLYPISYITFINRPWLVLQVRQIRPYQIGQDSYKNIDPWVRHKFLDCYASKRILICGWATRFTLGLNYIISVLLISLSLSLSLSLSCWESWEIDSLCQLETMVNNKHTKQNFNEEKQA